MRVCVSVCLSVCLPPRPLITSGVIWCDIDSVRLVKQVLRLFPAFNYFILYFAWEDQSKKSALFIIKLQVCCMKNKAQ